MRHRSLLPTLLFVSGLLLTSTVRAEPGAPASDVRLTGTAELGFLAVLDHNIQLSTSATDFDYDARGGGVQGALPPGRRRHGASGGRGRAAPGPPLISRRALSLGFAI